MKTAILVGGFIMSGKTAIRDFFAEIDGVDSPVPVHELVILAHPGGLLDLETSLVDNWNPYFSDIGIKRFQMLVKQLDRKFAFPYFYKNHNQITREFASTSKTYINRLCEFSHPGMWYGINTPYQKVFRKINQKLNTRLFTFYRKPMYFSAPGKEEFYRITRNYTTKLLELATRTGCSHYVIMEAYVSLNVNRIMNYFEDARMIISRRDPRDAFVNLTSVQADYYPVDDVGQFITAYRKTMEYFKEQGSLHPNVYLFDFEDLVLNYEQTTARILDVMNIDPTRHTRKRTRFKPEESVRNIGIWKRFPDQRAMDLIYRELKEFCFREE